MAPPGIIMVEDLEMKDASTLEAATEPHPFSRAAPGMRPANNDYMTEVAEKTSNPALAKEVYETVKINEAFVAEAEVAEAKQVYRSKAGLNRAIEEAKREEVANMQSLIDEQAEIEAQLAKFEAERAMNRRLWDKFLAEKPERERKRVAKRQARVDAEMRVKSGAGDFAGEDHGMIY